MGIFQTLNPCGLHRCQCRRISACKGGSLPQGWGSSVPTSERQTVPVPVARRAAKGPRFLGGGLTSMAEKLWNVGKKEHCIMANQGNMESTKQDLRPEERAPVAAAEQAAIGVGEARGTAWLGSGLSALRRSGVRLRSGCALTVFACHDEMAEQGRALHPNEVCQIFLLTTAQSINSIIPCMIPRGVNTYRFWGSVCAVGG
jgi:hypothetical protein